MSFNGEYETSKVGPTTSFTFNNTGAAVNRIILKASATRRTSFAIRAVIAPVRIRQGGSGVTIGGGDVGLQLTTTLRWRIDVEASEELYLAFVGDDSTGGGSIEVTKISDAADYATGETPALA